MSGIKINADQRLFVIPCGEGFSCHGFDVVYRELEQIIEKMAAKNVILKWAFEYAQEAYIGTLEQYAVYQKAVQAMRESGLKFGTWFNPKTPKKVQRILEDYRKSDDKIRIFLGDANTGRDWMEENDVMGRIGRSGGIMHIPLLISDDECGGPGLLDACIVRMMDVATGEELYRHPKYHQAEMEICPTSEHVGYTHAVKVNGTTSANFKSMGKAAAYVAFMTGESFKQPD